MANMIMSHTTASDDYETPSALWDIILSKINTSYTIWEAFYLNGNSGEYIKNKGFNVYHENRDFFSYEPECDIIVSNPPYSKRRQVFKRLKELNKPWAMLVPLNTIANEYMHSLFDNISIVIPKKRCGFIKNGIQMKSPNFEIVWICWGFGTPNTLIYA